MDTRRVPAQHAVRSKYGHLHVNFTIDLLIWALLQTKPGRTSLWRAGGDCLLQFLFLRAAAVVVAAAAAAVLLVAAAAVVAVAAAVVVGAATASSLLSLLLLLLLPSSRLPFLVTALKRSVA